MCCTHTDCTGLLIAFSRVLSTSAQLVGDLVYRYTVPQTHFSIIPLCCIVRCVFVALALEWYSRCKYNVTHAMEMERSSMVSGIPLSFILFYLFSFSLDKDRCKECDGRKVVRSRKIIEVCAAVV